MLVDLQVKGGKITDRETYKQGILAREENGSTAVGEGIAILHAKNAAVKAPSLAAMTVPEGVDYEALDDEPSNLLFMIAAPSDGGDVHFEVLSRLMVILMDEDFRAKLLAAESKEAFLQVIDEMEREKYPDEPQEAPKAAPEADGRIKVLAVIGVGDAFLQAIQNGMEAIVDGFTGEIFVNPDEATKARLLEKQQKDLEQKRLLQERKGKKNITKDGTEIQIYANIGGVDHIGAVLMNDAGGIGLFRSEFLYLENSDYPTEEQQFLAYKRVLESMAGKKVIIRMLDIGADKQVDYFNLKKEDNPAMGYRAIRICLTRPDIFKTQLRALYQASVYGNLGIMFPIITSISKVQKVLEICKTVREELQAEQIPYAEKIELGIMIETPAAAIISDQLAPLVDFFSVGTNDLPQYTLACDRQNPDIESFCDTHHEAILRLIAWSAKNAHEHGAWIGICGELAADTSLTERFLRMGIDELSVSPTFVLKVRDAVRKVDLRTKEN